MSSPVWRVWTTHTGDGRLDYERAGMLNVIASGSFRFQSGAVFRVYQSTWCDEGQRTRRSQRGCCSDAGKKGTAIWPWGDSGHEGADRNRGKMAGLVSADRSSDWRTPTKPSHRELRAPVIRRTEEQPENWEIAGRWGEHRAHAGRIHICSFGLRCNTGGSEQVVLSGPEGLRNHCRHKTLLWCMRADTDSLKKNQVGQRVPQANPWALGGTRDRGCSACLPVHQPSPGRRSRLGCFPPLHWQDTGLQKGGPILFHMQREIQRFNAFSK